MADVSEEQIDSDEQEQHGTKRIKKSKRGGKKGHKMISSTYQTKKCEFFNRGSCHKGDQCTYSHSFTPDVAKKICKFFLSNSCSKGVNCPYSHNTKIYPCKFYHIQKSCLQGQDCRFSHDLIHPEFQEEFLKDNQDFLIKLLKQDWKLHHRYMQYILQNDLINKQKKEETDQNKSSTMPYIFGISSPIQNSNTANISPIDSKKAKDEVKDPRLLAKQKANEKVDPRLKNRPKANDASPQFNLNDNKKEQKSMQAPEVKEKFYMCLSSYMRSFY